MGRKDLHHHRPNSQEVLLLLGEISPDQMTTPLQTREGNRAERRSQTRGWSERGRRHQRRTQVAKERAPLNQEPVISSREIKGGPMTVPHPLFRPRQVLAKSLPK